MTKLILPAKLPDFEMTSEIANVGASKMQVSFRKDCRSLADGTATSLKKSPHTSNASSPRRVRVQRDLWKPKTKAPRFAASALQKDVLNNVC